jgi:Uma2 family endonuclease
LRPRPRGGFYPGSHPSAADVLLLIEVADSSLAQDRGPKVTLYARHGVPEVWIVDLIGPAVEIGRDLGPDGYAERRRTAEGMATPILVQWLDSTSLRCWASGYTTPTRGRKA